MAMESCIILPFMKGLSCWMSQARFTTLVIAPKMALPDQIKPIIDIAPREPDASAEAITLSEMKSPVPGRFSAAHSSISERMVFESAARPMMAIRPRRKGKREKSA